jgi:hypothetical protein
VRNTAVTTSAAVVRAGLAATLIAGCGLNLSETPPPSGPIPTAMASAPGDLAAVRDALDASLRTAAGVGLDDAPEGYRPAEPASFTYVPRTVAKVRLPNDPNRIYVVFYAFPAADQASAAAQQATAFYSSGPGLVQFPADTQFAIAPVGDVVVFAAWAPSLTTDQATASAAFTAIKAFGHPGG